MPTLIALWTEPNDPDAFSKDYLATHVGLCQALPGIKSVTTSTTAPGGPYHRISLLRWDSADEMNAAFGSAEIGPLMADTGRLTETFGNKVDTLMAPEL